MKIALVNVSDGAEAYGIISLASYIKQHSDFKDIGIVSLNEFGGFITQSDIPVEDYIKKIVEMKPDIVGLSAMTVFYGKAIEIAKAIRQNEAIKDCKILIGGVHISTLPSSFKLVFDYGVMGEGEETLLELFSYIHQNKEEDYTKLQSIKGIVYHKEGEIKINVGRELITPLDKIPMPLPEFAKLNVMPRYERGKKINAVVIMTSRGCPYDCVFCSTTNFWGNKIRFFSAKRVVDEIEMWYNDYGAIMIGIWDDLFTINKQRLREIIDLLKERGLLGKIRYECLARSNTIDEEVCVLLKELGVYELNFGFESGSPRMLAFLKKNSVTLDQHKNAIILARKHGISVTGSIIFASPGEKIEDMEKTLEFIDFCIKNKVSHIWSFTMTPFPGTEIWRIAKERGIVSEDMDWSKLSHFNQEDPPLLDEDIKLEDFKKIWFKNKSKQRYFLVKIWLKNFRDAPVRTTIDVFKSFRFLKFFTKDFF